MVFHIFADDNSRVCALFASTGNSQILTLFNHDDELSDRTVHQSKLHRTLHLNIPKVSCFTVHTQQTAGALQNTNMLNVLYLYKNKPVSPQQHLNPMKDDVLIYVKNLSFIIQISWTYNKLFDFLYIWKYL